MNNLIPKNVRKSKLEFWRGIGIIEIFVVALWIGLAALFFLGLPISLLYKFIFTVIISLFAIPLIISIMPGIKGWYALILLIKFLVSKKSYCNEYISLLCPYDKVIENDIIKTKKIKGKNKYFKVIEIIGYNITLLNPDIQQIKISNLHQLFKNIDFEISLLKLDLPVSFEKSINFYNLQLKNLKDLYEKKNINFREYESRKLGLKSYITKMQKNNNQNENLTIGRMFYLFVYANKKEELQTNLKMVWEKLERNGFHINVLSGYQTINIINKIYNPYNEDLAIDVYNEHASHLETLPLFTKFKYSNNHFKINNIYYSINGVYDYPLFPRSCWGAQMVGTEQTIIWNINPIENRNFKKSLNKAINNTRTKQFMSKSNIDRSEQSYQLQAYEQLMEDMNGNAEAIRNVNILFLNYGLSLKLLHQSENRLKKILKEQDIIIDPLKYRQLEAYSAFLPMGEDNLIAHVGHEIPCSALANSFPLLNGGLNDEQGLYLGSNILGDTIIFDQFKITEKRKNHNKIIIGTSGSGKSHTTKKEIAFHLNLGRTVIAIDPEREYQQLCYFYDGQWVDTGDATRGRINPLQVLDNSFREEQDYSKKKSHNLDWDVEEEITEAPVSNHLRLLDQWFKTLYKEMSERERRILLNNVQMTYQKFNITNKTIISEIPNNKFPTFDDLYQTINEQLKKRPNDTILHNLHELIYYDFMNDGQYKQLWNGYTTLKLTSTFVVYDVWTLFDQDIPTITAAQLHLVLAFVKGEVKRNRFKNNNEIIIVIDEAHLAIDKDNPVALNFMYQMVKRIRKYKGAIIITTQNWNDFSGTEEIKKKTTAMINNTQYSMIMNLAPSDLRDVSEVYQSYGGLSPEEQEYISRAGKREMLLIISGYDRHCLKIDISEFEEQSFKNIDI